MTPMLRAWICTAVLALGLGAAEARAQTLFDLAAAERRQPALMEQLAAGLPAQRPGVVDVYVIGVAADGETDVFLNEARAAVDILSDRLGARGAVLLSNDPRTWLTTPLASPATLDAAIALVGRKLNREEDVLVVFITSHGLPQGVVFSAPPSPARPILGPIGFSRMLEDNGPRHRAVIVSACYSGVYVEPLKADGALVITAARGDRVSFGCEAGRDWTYFGDAFFANGLKNQGDLTTAFSRATALVDAWEKRDKLTPPSEPQMFVGATIKAKLDAAAAPRLTRPGN